MRSRRVVRTWPHHHVAVISRHGGVYAIQEQGHAESDYYHLEPHGDLIDGLVVASIDSRTGDLVVHSPFDTTSALAVIGSTPGIASRVLLSSSCRCQPMISASIFLACRSNYFRRSRSRACNARSVNSLLAFSGISATRRAMWWMPCGTISPYRPETADPVRESRALTDKTLPAGDALAVVSCSPCAPSGTHIAKQAQSDRQSP